MNRIAIAAYTTLIVDNENAFDRYIRKQANGMEPFQQNFKIDPPGLRGLSRLTARLNSMERSGDIRRWSMGRWVDAKKTELAIHFASVLDRKVATSALRSGV